ncbi:hypothetical protein H5410_048407 [Solanum commersonii]|uniref:Uncharacterized protein n=1 Tax=Solanum commersonii TaxID=4109 RepID=A0A9J5XJL6_SOLCO|nr:hypothetical protein H5410_048407 [Solanum commersonii]
MVCNPGSGAANRESSVQKSSTKSRPTGLWFEEDGLFNLDEEGRIEKQQFAVAASNVVRTSLLCQIMKSSWASIDIA